MNPRNAILSIALLIMAVFSYTTAQAQSQAAQNSEENIEFNVPWTGDFDGMVKRGFIRVLVVHSKILFFLDRGKQLGTVPLLAAEFEKFINVKLKRKTLKVKVLMIPVRRDQLIPHLMEGRGDIISANLTITPERQKLVDFADAGISGVKEILVTGPTAPAMKSVDDLSGKTLTVRKSSSYHDSLLKLNQRFKSAGKAPVVIKPAAEYLEDSDLLEMVNAGMLEMAIVDSHKAEFWVTVFDKLTHHPEIFVRKGGKIASAMRKNSPQFKKIFNEFIRKNRKGTLMGNIALNRYLRDNKWARNTLSQGELEKFRAVVKLFQKYAKQYDFDYLMTTALAYQESGLDQSKRSHVGAIGIMQIMQGTAKDRNVAIAHIEKLEPNIHAGTKYLRHLRDHYFDDPAVNSLNQMLFSFAAYNAGPNRLKKLRAEAKRRKLDPNVWFNNVEIIAARRIGRETVQYVSNIYKYYIAYNSIAGHALDKEAAMPR